MSIATIAQARALAAPLRETKSSDPSVSIVADSVIQTHLDNADSEISARFRRHYDVTAAAFKTDAVIVLLAARYGAMSTLRDVQGQKGNENRLAATLQQQIDDTVRRIIAPRTEDERITLSVTRRTDNAEGASFPSSVSSTVDTPALFDPTKPSMQSW